MLLLSVFVWNYFILNVSNTRAGSATYEYRYHLMGVLPLMCITVMIIVQWFRSLSPMQQKWLFLCGFMTFFVFQGLVFREVFIRGEQNGSLKELVAYMDDTDLTTVFMYYGSNDADICRLLDEDCLYLHVGNEGLTWVYDYYSKYEDAQLWTEDAIVAVFDAEHNMGDSFELGGHVLVRFNTVGGRSLYYFAH